MPIPNVPGADVLAVTQKTREKGYIDIAYESTPLMQLLMVKPLPSGYRLKSQVAVRDDVGTGRDIKTGYETLGRITKDRFETVEQGYAFTTASVTISRKDLIENTGPDALVQLWDDKNKAELKNRMRLMERHLIRRSTAVTSIFNDLLSFDGTADTYSHFENANFGAQSNTPGGLSRATYENWGHYRYDIASDFEANGEEELDKMHQRAVDVSPGLGAVNILCSPAFQRRFKGLYKDQIRYTPTQSLENFNPLLIMVNGSKTTFSFNLPYDVGDDAVSAYCWRPEAIQLAVDKNHNWKADELKAAYDQLAIAQDYIWRGQLWIREPRATALIVNGES